jgi:GST-like protein
MIDLYGWPTPNLFKVTILLEELGLPYNPISGAATSSSRIS